MKYIQTLILIISIILSYGCSEVKEEQEQTLRTVITAVVGEKNSSGNSRFAGELRATERAALSFEIGGVVTSLDANLGEQFNKDDILGRLDSNRAELVLKSSEADLLNAASNLKEAQLEYDRRNSLRDTGAVSIASIDQAETQLEIAVAKMSAAKAGVETAKIQLGDTILQAPFAGEVVNRLVEPSQVVYAGQPVFEVVGNNSGLEAIIATPDFIKQSIAIGSIANVRILASRETLQAKVTEIGNRANNVGLFPVVLSLIGDHEGASSGQSIEATFDAKYLSNSRITIPVSSYGISPNGQAYVFVVDKADQFSIARRQNVELGEMLGAGIEITKGLATGTEIITKGVDFLKDGQKVLTLNPNEERFGN